MTEQDAAQVAAPPPGRDLAWSNRRLIAERGGWPAGALEACEQIEAAHPNWQTHWMPENKWPGSERREGFYASREGGRRERDAYGADPAALSAAIEAVVSCCPKCGLQLSDPAGTSLPPHDVPGTEEMCKVHWSSTSVAIRSGCPACGTELDVRPGSDVPPHRVGGKWCGARCSQRTV